MMMQSQTEKSEAIGSKDGSPPQKHTGLPPTVMKVLRNVNDALRYRETVTKSLYNEKASSR